MFSYSSFTQFHCKGSPFPFLLLLLLFHSLLFFILLFSLIQVPICCTCLELKWFLWLNLGSDYQKCASSLCTYNISFSYMCIALGSLSCTVFFYVLEVTAHILLKLMLLPIALYTLHPCQSSPASITHCWCLPQSS